LILGSDLRNDIPFREHQGLCVQHEAWEEGARLSIDLF
jgi:hypothetical protein